MVVFMVKGKDIRHLGRLEGDGETAIALCAEEPGAGLPEVVRREVWGLADPLAHAEGEVEAALRRTRDELRRRIEALVASWV